MSQISRIANYQPQTANDLLKLVYNNDKDGSIYKSLKTQFKFGDSETISSIVKSIANGIDETYKDRGMGRVFNDTFSNPSSSSSSLDDDNSSFRLSSLKDDGNMDARPNDRYTISNRPLTNVSPLAGPYFCPETPDRVMVDGIIVVNRADEVRNFFNGQVMVMHIRGGDPNEYKTPGTLRCGIVDKYRKAVQEYENLYQKSASRGSNFIPWTFYLDNVGYSEEEEVAEIDKVTQGGDLNVSFSRFDGRDNFGYVKFLNFQQPTAPDSILDVIKVDDIVNFFKRAKGEKYEVYSDKILGDNDTIRFLEDKDKPGMTQSARERVQKFLKSDQTIVITINKKFLVERGFDDKMVTLFNIVKRLRRTNSAFYDRIAYYFYDEENVIPKYKYTTQELEWAEKIQAKFTDLDDDGVKQKVTGLAGADVLDKGDLNDLYNCNIKSRQNTGHSSTSLFQIIRGSKSTTVLEMYIAKDAPDYYTSYSYAEENDFTQKLCRDNIVNLMCVPYVTETLLSQFAQRSEIFPMLTSESRARRFYVRPLAENPFVEAAATTRDCFIFKHDQLPPSIIEDLKNGMAVILHPECDGTEGSCIPPQLHAIASRYNATVHEAHKSLFDFAHGAKVVLMRAERRFATNNFELFMISGLKWTQYDLAGNCAAITDPTYNASDCKFTSSELDIPRILDFLNKQKLSGRSFRAPSRAVGGARPVGNLVTLWNSL